MKVKAKALWSCLDKPNTMSGKYQVTLANLDADSIKALKSEGVEVKKGTGDKKDWGDYIVAKSKEKYFKVVDATKSPLPEGKKIGNGSEVVAIVNTYPWEFKNKKGIGVGLQALMVKKLVEFAGEDLSELDDEVEENLGF